MARGFESKDVEGQQQEAEERRAARERIELSQQEAELARKREGLELQRTRMLREIETCSNERHRQTLQNGLTFLNDQLASLDN